MKSLYDSALSGISKLMDNQIDGYQETKESAVESLEAEKEARLEVIETQKEQLEAQIDLIDEQIKAKEDIIDSIQDEIDAMREANDERKRQIDLQKAEYNLERMMNQRTDLAYQDGQMVYRPDGQGARDAKEEVDDAKLEIEIAKKEKEISLIEDEIELLEDTKDAIQEQIDLLDEQSNQIEEYYSKMISSTEKYYDSLIKNVEKQKSKWEELAEIHEVAEAWSAIQQVFGDLGYTVDDVLNGSVGAFEDFKSKYIALINDMNSNSSFAEGLSYATGVAKEDLGSFLNKTQEVSDGLDELAGKSDDLDSISDSMDSIGSSASTASTNTSAISEDIQELNTNSEGLDTKLSGISTALESIPDGTKFNGLTEAFRALGEEIENISTALGVGTEGTVGGLIGALTQLSEISLGGESADGEESGGTGIIKQFNNLKTAVDTVTSAINGGGGSMTGESGMLATGTNGGSNSPSEGGEGGSGGLVGAIKEIGTKVTETFGESSGDEGSEGGGEGVLSKFSQFKEAVDAVTNAIGVEGESGEAEENTLLSALQLHYEKAEETLPEVKTLFEELLSSITSCVDKLGELAGGISSLGSIDIGDEGSGGDGGKSFPTLFAKGTDPSKSFGNIAGQAFAKGTGMFNGVSKDTLALRSEYGQPETTIYPDGTVELTNSPTIDVLPKGTKVLNEKQTIEALGNDKGKIIGNAFANGTEGKLPRLNRDEMSTYDFIMEATRRWKDAKNNTPEELMRPIGGIYENTEKMLERINNINNTDNRSQQVNFGDIHVHCSGITSKDVAEQAVTEIQRSMFGLSNYALQKSSVTR